MVRNEIIEALELVKEGCKQTLLSCSFLCSTQNFYVQERNPLCTFFFLETVYLGATTLFKKISRNKDVKSSNCSLVCHYNTSSLAKFFLFYFQQFLKYIYYTIMMYFFLFSFIFLKSKCFS